MNAHYDKGVLKITLAKRAEAKPKQIEILKQNPSVAVRVLVVWEPMLPTDWSRPGGLVQGGASSNLGPTGRAVWDKDHLVAKELQQQLSTSQICCQRNGLVWDVAAIYPRDIQWGSSTPAFFGGAVLDVAGDVRQHLSALTTDRELMCSSHGELRFRPEAGVQTSSTATALGLCRT